MSLEIEKTIKPKRGRKKNSEKKAEIPIEKKNIVEKIPKKRGRKPKGGKLISAIGVENSVNIPQPNIILHLKCFKSELSNTEFFNNQYIDNYKFDNKSKDLLYDIIETENKNELLNDNKIKKKNLLENNDIVVEENNKNLYCKLNKLAINLHNNNISDKKSACFWCTHDFDNPPIFIPKYELENSYHCYGCFCSPECATAFLFKENIDASTKFERYHLINNLYCKIYNYKKNVKPAPDPHYVLEKFYGNLSIQEYRKQLQNERLLLVIDKPLTRILPELHEDNDEFVLNNNSIPSASNYRLSSSKKHQTKAEVLVSKFNLKF